LQPIAANLFEEEKAKGLPVILMAKLVLVGETTGGGFETLRGDKTQSFISGTKAYKHNKLTIHALSLFLSSVSL
jgi:hypothetical protein